MARPLASTGIPGRIGDVHIDVIEEVSAPRNFDRTSVAIESGAPITAHRQRVPYTLTIRIMVSDVEPIAGATLAGLWETRHAVKTRERLHALQERGEAVQFFDGRNIYRTPSGSKRWIIDDIEETKTPELAGAAIGPQAWSATIKLGEIPTFTTEFTSIDANVDESIQDSTDGVVDKGTQSTELVPDTVAASIPI